MVSEQRLTAEDRLDIMDLYARHAWAQDGGDLDAYADVFAPDAVAYGNNVGVVGIRAYLRSFVPDAAFPGSQHFAMNWCFVGGDRQRHKVRAYVVRLHRIPGTTNCQIVWQGFYSDTVVKIDGRWKFQIKQSPNAEELQAGRLDFEPTPPQNKAAFDLYDLGHPRAIPTPSPEDLSWKPSAIVRPALVSPGAGPLTPEDRLDIMELAARYAWAMDGGDPAAYADVPLELPSSSPTNTGDGLIMAMGIGAALGNMTEAWWAPAVHVPGEEYEDGPMNRHISWPRCQPGSIMVNRQGRRFVNDALNYNDVTKAMMVFDPARFDWANLPCWLIFDREYRRNYDFAGVTPDMPDPDWVAKAATLRELALAVGIDPEGLIAQVEAFNVHAARGEDPPLGSGPYYALELRIGGMGTKGGPVIDPGGRVIAASGRAVPGFYAAGNVVANVFGPSYPGPGATLASGTTFARLGAESMIAEQATAVGPR